MAESQLRERGFLITQAVHAFNRQRGTNVKPADCDIRSIPHNKHSHRGYEVYSKRFDDYLRLRTYFTFSNIDNLDIYHLEVDGSDGSGRPNDEVWVTTGTLDNYHRESDLYKFNWLVEDQLAWEVFITEDDISLVTEDGENFLLEQGL